MPLLPMDKAMRRRRILRINIFVGLAIFAAAFFRIATGDFGSYNEAKSAETMYNIIAISGLLYAAFLWMYCMLSKPFWFPFMKRDK